MLTYGQVHDDNKQLKKVLMEQLDHVVHNARELYLIGIQKFSPYAFEAKRMLRSINSSHQVHCKRIFLSGMPGWWRDHDGENVELLCQILRK